MAELKRVELPEINLDYLKKKLEYLYSRRSSGSYPEEDVRSSFEVLASYWDAKNSTNLEKSKAFFDNLHAIWRMLKPELKAILLEDMIVNASDKTERFLFARDPELRAMGEDFKEKVGEEGTQELGPRVQRATTIFSGGRRANEHFFGLEDLQLIREYIHDATFEKHGFSNEGPVSEIDRIHTRFLSAAKYKGFSEISAYIYASQNLDACMYMAEQSKRFTPEAVRENIRIALKNDRSKMIIVQNPKIVQSRINLIDFLCDDPSMRKEQLLTFKNAQQYMGVIMLQEGQICLNDFGGLRPEIEQAMQVLTYPNPPSSGKESLPFNMLKDYVERYDSDILLRERAIYVNGKLETIRRSMGPRYAEQEARFKARFEAEFLDIYFKRLMINYAFGTLNGNERAKLSEIFERASEYHEDLRQEMQEYHFDTIDLEPSAQGTERPTPSPKPKNQDPKRRIHREFVLDEDFLKQVVNNNLRWTGIVLKSPVGTRAEGMDRVYYYTFVTPGGYYILHPHEQKNNATFVIKLSEDGKGKAPHDLQDLARRLSDRRTSLDGLVESGEAFRVYNPREDGEYREFPARLKLIAEVVERTRLGIVELRRNALAEIGDYARYLTPDELVKMVTQKINISDVPKVSSYIRSLIEAYCQGREEEMGIRPNTLNEIRKKVHRREVETRGKGE